MIDNLTFNIWLNFLGQMLKGIGLPGWWVNVDKSDGSLQSAAQPPPIDPADLSPTQPNYKVSTTINLNPTVVIYLLSFV